MPHCLIDNELQNTDKKHIKTMKNNLHILENSAKQNQQINNKITSFYSADIFPHWGKYRLVYV